MSREFGEYVGGYFHDKIESATQDLEDAHYSLHKKLIPVLESLYEIAYAISSVEAGDSGEERSIEAFKKHIPYMVLQLEGIDRQINRTAKDEFYRLTNAEDWEL